MKAGINKQFLTLQDIPVLAHTLSIFETNDMVKDVIVVAAADEEESCSDIVRNFKFAKVKRIVTGGKERQESVANGLAQVSEKCTVVAVHDGARPLLLSSYLTNLITAVEEVDGAILAVRVKDTIKEVGGNLTVAQTMDRGKLWAVQTPQVFKKDVIIKAYNQAFQEKFMGTDDASLVERCGYNVKVIEGSYENIKITTPEDLEFAELVLRRRS